MVTGFFAVGRRDKIGFRAGGRAGQSQSCGLMRKPARSGRPGGAGKFPLQQIIQRHELVGDDGEPEKNLKPALRTFVAEPLLGDERTGPAAGHREQMQGRLGNPPVRGLGTHFIERVGEISDRREREHGNGGDRGWQRQLMQGEDGQDEENGQRHELIRAEAVVPAGAKRFPGGWSSRNDDANRVHRADSPFCIRAHGELNQIADFRKFTPVGEILDVDEDVSRADSKKAVSFGFMPFN